MPKELCAVQYAKALLEFNMHVHKLTEIHIVDMNHDMIDIIHQVFDLMVNQKRSIDLDLMRYCQVGAMGGGDTEDRKSHSKNEAGHMSVNKAFANDESEHNKMGLNVTYINDGSKLKCLFTPDMEVHIYEADILKIQGVHVLVCSENRQGEAKGEISSQLVQTNGKEYRNEKSKKFKKAPKNYGDMVFTSGGKSNFALIIHAISPRNQMKALNMMYMNLFERFVNENINSVALPLLGTGIFYVKYR